MTVKIKNIIIVIFVIIIIILFCIFVNKSQGIKVEAASAFYPYAVDYFADNENIAKIKLVSTENAYKDIIDGTADIIIATKPSDEQQEEIEKSSVELEFITLYEEPLAILVNINNEIENLNIEQLQEIYNKNNSNWSDYGGQDIDINTYQLEKNNGSQTAFETIVKNNTLGVNHLEVKTMNEIIDNVARDNSGISYSFYTFYSKMYYNENVKIININNENILSENYPLLFDVYLIYKKDNQNVKQYIENLNLF